MFIHNGSAWREGAIPDREFLKNLEDIFSREKQLARSEYRPRASEEKKKKRTDGGEERREKERYLVLAANEGGWKVNYLWEEGRYTARRGEEREVKGWDGTGFERIERM